MSVTAILVLVLFTFTAAFIQRVSGFGFGIFIMTVLPHLMPSYAEATALSGLLAIVTALITAAAMYRYLVWRKLLSILIAFIAVSFFSVMMVANVDSHLLRKVLGIVMIAISINFFFISERIHLRPTFRIQVTMGALSGMMGGLFAMQGPPAVVYFIGSCKSKEEYIAETQWYFLIGNIAMTFFRAGNGFVTPFVLTSFLWTLPAVFAGLWAGSKVYEYISLPLLRKVIYLYMAVAGVLAIVI